MTTALATIDLAEPGQVDQALQFLTQRLKLQDVECRRAEIEVIVSKLSLPCRPDWLMGRVAVLLDPYFDKGTAYAMRVANFEIWADELVKYPEWAIDRAVRWWKSKDNPKRRQRPLEGDIAERAHREMDAVNTMCRALKAEPYTPLKTPKRRPEPTQEEKARMAAYVDKVLKSMRAK